jgi:TolA-binding protein
VTKKFPNSNKVPHALLKQGFSFLSLGDKASARLLLQQVIKDYPNTNQAKTARAKLQQIK